jgi:hypothetical protein
MSDTLPTTVDEMLDWWPGNIPFKGQLISSDGCMCAQGQVLHLIGGMTPDDLRRMQQADADKRTAELLGISRAHAVLLRQVNDNQPGAPTCVIREPEKVLGSEARSVLAFWRHLDRMTEDDWAKVDVAPAAAAPAWAAAADAAWEAAADAAWDAAAEATWVAAGAAAWEAAAKAAAGASNEIQGAAVMRERGQPFFFLPLFGFSSPEDVTDV